ncbi:MAG: septum site-determining protein MinC [Alicyclobacillaceae bacterium]|uniref:septum site-determining protein MinC n=1 Tax=Alicyclobacillus sp. SP_1 TaxID=2942475 RepID=UPI002157C5F9|nr:septum site-determining protein MinC [Alicyclobacillus sp. SP_1]MCY0888919.1 septum site-determining protein MinC [Alicyclobacillaceae bacterium]MCY0896337.1 septum site-determining protein MinC [Alicyclobacillaceae bacterium]
MLDSERLATDSKPNILLKGTKEGLLLLLNEVVSFESLLEDLSTLIHGEKKSLFEGPDLKISVDYGERVFAASEIREILDCLAKRENLILREWGPSTAAKLSLFNSSRKFGPQTLLKGTVRAGQRPVFEGDVVVIGDVNPGAEIVASGDIYVLGRLRGIAHAGFLGDWSAIIAAAEFAPMQLRIADIVSRAPERDGKPLRTFMEFAYLKEDSMAVDKLDSLHAWTAMARQSS